MDELRSDDQQLKATPARSRRKPIVLVFTGLVLVAAGWLLWGTSPALPEGPLVARRAADGTFDVEGRVPSKGISGHLSALKLDKTAWSSSSTTSSGSSAFMGRSLALFCLTDNPLAQRLGYDLFQKLQESKRFDELHYYPHDEQPAEGQLLPELFATIDVPTLEEGGVMPSRTLKAQVKLTLGDQYRRSSHGYRGTLSPPIVEFRWESTIDCKARNIGIETASARYQAISDELTADLLKSMEKEMDDLAQKHGQFASRPPEFFPEFIPAPEFPFLKDLDARRLLTGPNFMHSNVTVWRIDPPGELGATMQAVAEGLKNAGWEGSELDKATEKTAFRLMRRQAGESIECFEGQDGRSPKTLPEQVYLVYTKSMTSDQVAESVKALAAQDVSEAAFEPFSGFWYLAPESVADYFTRNTPRLVPSLIHLARQDVKAGNLEAARSLIRRAAAMHHILKFEAPNDELKKLAKEAGLEQLPRLPDLSILIPDVVTDLRQPKSFSASMGVEDPRAFLVESDDEEQHYLVLKPRSFSEDRKSIRCEVVDLTLRDGGRSTGTTSADYEINQQRLLTQFVDEAGKFIQVFLTPSAAGEDSVTAEIVVKPLK